LKIKRRDEAPLPAKVAPKSFPIVGIGASAGGLEAFSDLLHHLPEKTGMAFVLVQHLDPKHGSDLREILARTTKVPVQEVTDGMRVAPDHVYVIPPNTSMAMKAGALRLAARTLTRGQHMPIDHFLSSLAEDCGNRAISVILSGTASDGTEGSRAVKAVGGVTFAQDETSAKYSGMPHSAAYAGCVDFVLPPAAIARELIRMAQHPYLAPNIPGRPDPGPATGDQMATLLSLLREATAVDFTHYKQTTLQRRIKRRMVLHKVDNLKDYVKLVGNTPGEIEELYQDILIHVTGFFRDPASFETLRKQVFPALFADSKRGSPVRVWVPGCSTGEEVYSLAMAMLDYLWRDAMKTPNTVGATPFQIFATDISDASLDRARAGIYTESLVSEISPERLLRFFVRLDGGYQIVKPVREMCIFARQNVAKDPPFSNMDLVSCRNLLIYLGPVLQKRVVPALHYALRPSGYLMLGGAENLGTFSEYFMPVDKKNKIYQKKKSAARLVTNFGGLEDSTRRADDPRVARPLRPVTTIDKEVDRILMDRFVPASIVVNEHMEIVQFRGKTGAYLEPPAGQPTFSLSKMAREGLLVDLRAALTRARKENATVRREGVPVHSDGHSRLVDLEVSPLRGPNPGERFYVIVFQEARVAEHKRGREAKTPQAPVAGSRESTRLRRELARIREQFQLLIEEHDSASEEFKSANEEMLSANEELQSTNEELETAKEELQSTNEELITLSEELQNRNLELTEVNNDLLNLLGNVSIPVVIVGQDLHIRRFTPPAQKLLNLLPGDVGRRMSEIRPNIEVEDLGQFARESIENVGPVEREVQEKKTGAWYLMRARPYKTWDNKIDGAVITFQDIDGMKRTFDLMHEHAKALIENAREAILVLDNELRVVSANQAFYRNFAVTRAQTENRLLYELGEGQWNIPKLRKLLEDILPSNGRVQDFEVRYDSPSTGPRKMMLNGGRIEPGSGQKMILLYLEDVTGNTLSR